MLAFRSLFILCLISSMLVRCASKEPKHLNSLWVLQMQIEGDSIPVRMEFDGVKAIIYNHNEQIKCVVRQVSTDSFTVSTPIFNSIFSIKKASDSITGVWQNLSRDEYFIPFTGLPAKYDFRFSQAKLERKYAVNFSPNTSHEYPSVGLFHFTDTTAFGTFITETGDYRYLQGNVSGSTFKLSCFDGSHLFLFAGEMVDDTHISGVFKSGKHWEEPFEGELDYSAILNHPDSITRLLNPAESFSMKLINENKDTVLFSNNSFKGQVTIIQILGSWCPNCMDESNYYKSLYEKYHPRGLSIIPVAFEKGKTLDKQIACIQNYKINLGISYPAYIGGGASKDDASKRFSMLDRVSSFPTSIFIDKNGVVRKIHTGFYGPGTGDYYNRYVLETDVFIQSLLEE